MNKSVPVQPRKLLPSEVITKVIQKAGRIFFEPIKTLSLAAGATTTINFTNQDSLPFLFTKIIGYAQVSSSGVETKAYTVKFKDSGRSQLMMDVAMHGSALGSRQWPTILEVPYLVRASGQFQAEVTNLTGVDIDIFITFCGYKIMEVRDEKNRSAVDVIKQILMQAGSLYFQSVSVSSLAAGGISRVPFTNQDNIPFIMSKIVGYAEDSSTLAQSLNFTLSFKDSGMIQLWQNTPMYGSAIGSGDKPTVLEAPYPLQGTSTFETEFTNIDSAATLNAYVTFIGYKLNGIQI